MQNRPLIEVGVILQLCGTTGDRAAKEPIEKPGRPILRMNLFRVLPNRHFFIFSMQSAKLDLMTTHPHHKWRYLLIARALFDARGLIRDDS